MFNRVAHHAQKLSAARNIYHKDNRQNGLKDLVLNLDRSLASKPVLALGALDRLEVLFSSPNPNNAINGCHKNLAIPDFSRTSGFNNLADH
jgi:hypothetical protein